MSDTKVTLTVEVSPAGGFREVTTWKVEPAGIDLDRIKSKLRTLARELEGQGRLDVGDDGKV